MITSDLSKSHGEHYDILMYTDSQKLFDALTKRKGTEKRRLMIDILAAR